MEGCAPPHRCLAGDDASPRPLRGSTRPIGCHLGLFLAPTRAAALRAPKSYSPSRREGSFSETHSSKVSPFTLAYAPIQGCMRAKGPLQRSVWYVCCVDLLLAVTGSCS